MSGPLAEYDRQAHLAWHERQYPDAGEWPPEPRTDAEAARYIAQYAGSTDASHDASPHRERLRSSCGDMSSESTRLTASLRVRERSRTMLA